MRQPSNYKTLQEIGEYAARQARLPDGRLYEVILQHKFSCSLLYLCFFYFSICY